MKFETITKLIKEIKSCLIGHRNVYNQPKNSTNKIFFFIILRGKLKLNTTIRSLSFVGIVSVLSVGRVVFVAYSAFWYDDGDSLPLESPLQSSIKFSPLPTLFGGEHDEWPSTWSSDARLVELKLLELYSSPSMFCEWMPVVRASTNGGKWCCVCVFVWVG